MNAHPVSRWEPKEYWKRCGAAATMTATPASPGKYQDRRGARPGESGRAGVRTIGLLDRSAAVRLSPMNTFLAVLTGGGLAALGGLGSGWLNNWLGSKRDERARAHEQQMAREVLTQERLDRAYTEMGIYLSHHADWARSVQSFLGPVPTPDPMPPEERWRIETLVMKHGSLEVRRLLERWREQAQKIENADIVIRMAEGPATPGGSGWRPSWSR